jgi:hypothetical protein
MFMFDVHHAPPKESEKNTANDRSIQQEKLNCDRQDAFSVHWRVIHENGQVRSEKIVIKNNFKTDVDKKGEQKA